MPRDWPLTGRDEECSYSVDAIAGGATRGVVLAGAAGVGKSRLASEILGRLRLLGRRVFACGATIATASIPFAAVAEIIPELAAADDNQLRVLRAVAHSLKSGDDGRPVIGLDDAHLADDATAALVHHLVTRDIADVVLTLRTGEPAPDAITATWKDGHCRRLDVQALARDDVALLTTAALGGSVEHRTLDRLWELSQGNPLLLHEIVWQSLDDGSLAEHRDVWRLRGEMSPTSRLIDVVGLRLGRLDDADRDAVALLAYGGPLGLAALERMVGGGWTANTLETRGVVRLTQDGKRLVASLAHPLYAEVVQAETTSSTARRLQQRLADDLVASGARRSGDAARLAAWGLAAGVALDAGVLGRAAREAYRANEFELAVRISRSDPEWATNDTGFYLGASLASLERAEESLAVLTEAAHAPPSDDMRARIAFQRMEVLFHQLQRHADAAAVFDEAMQTVEDATWRATLSVGWAPSLIGIGRHAEARALVESMAASDVMRTRLAAMRGLGYILVPEGQTTRVLALCDELLGPALDMREEWETGLFDVFATRVTALMMEGRLDEAEVALNLGEAATDATHEPSTVSFINVGRGRIALFRGQAVTAARWLREAAAGFTRLDLGVRGSWTLRLLGEALALVGDVDGAQAALEEARKNDGPLQDPFATDGIRAAAWVTAAAGETARAGAQLVAESAVVRALGQFGYEALMLHDAVRIGVVGLAPRLRELSELVDGSLVAIYADHAEALDRKDAAMLEDVARRFVATGFNLPAAEAAAAAAHQFRVDGLVARAATMAELAEELWATCEGARTPAMVGGTSNAGLTRREREIATLAARGSSSKQIAEALHVSVRTVDNHLQHAFAKLGVRRRDELARVLGLSSE